MISLNLSTPSSGLGKEERSQVQRHFLLFWSPKPWGSGSVGTFTWALRHPKSWGLGLLPREKPRGGCWILGEPCPPAWLSIQHGNRAMEQSKLTGWVSTGQCSGLPAAPILPAQVPVCTAEVRGKCWGSQGTSRMKSSYSKLLPEGSETTDARDGYQDMTWEGHMGWATPQWLSVKGADRQTIL